MSDLSIQNARIHQKKIQNLIKEQKNEIEKIKNNHQKIKNNTEVENNRDIASLQLRNEEEKINKIKKHEEILEDLQKNLDRVKKVTDKELRQVRTNHDSRINDEKTLFEQDLRNLKEKNALRAEEATAESNGVLRRINKNLERERSELNKNAKSELSLEKGISERQKELKAKEYRRAELIQSDNFNKALRKQTFNNNKILRKGENKFKNTLETRQNYHEDTLKNQEVTNNSRRLKNQEVFENRYQKSLTDNESMLQKMLGKKDRLIHKLQKELKTEKDLELSKKDDQFYSMGKLKLTIKELNDKKGYEIKIPVNKEEAKNVDFKAEKRELRFTMQRSHKFHTKDNNEFNSVNRLETYVRKVPVEDIIDPTTIKKSYKDGVLTFRIGLA